MNSWIVILIVLLPALCFGDLGLPNPPSTAIGDTGTLYLNDPGLFFDVHNNDWLGQTDKLVTFSSALAYFRGLQTKKEMGAFSPTPEALKLALNTRLLTPITSTRFDHKDLDQKVGIFAEWLELQIAYSRLFGRVKLELSFAGDFFGNFAGDNVYRYIHEVFASDDLWEDFGRRYEGTYGAGTVGIGYLWSDYLLSMIYYGRSQIMEEETIATSLIFPLSANFSIAGENRFVNQKTSKVYANPRPYRYEWAWGFKWNFWQVQFKYVSPYLEEDRWGQYYISPLILNWKF
ncbi:hypothetical protein QJS83_12925 [Bdellovibrio sp. 22V]|uniref:hypothetical protein n=1 Tax=Bdellovibrio TaxID=958 RepID=UPI002542C581|nr:hypothetical protein [Bdellovibrio sp. 22V]WII71366.1 hypothetical protein QJS83_12925 [Bdellovibrio sp. 22V]